VDQGIDGEEITPFPPLPDRELQLWYSVQIALSYEKINHFLFSSSYVALTSRLRPLSLTNRRSAQGIMKIGASTIVPLGCSFAEGLYQPKLQDLPGFLSPKVMINGKMLFFDILCKVQKVM
jgi:hypothetical protein